VSGAFTENDEINAASIEAMLCEARLNIRIIITQWLLVLLVCRVL